MTHADEPLTVAPRSSRDQHVHRALSETKKYAESLRHAPAGPTGASCWRRRWRWGTWGRCRGKGRYSAETCRSVRSFSD
jgi:hypothetical protein